MSIPLKERYSHHIVGWRQKKLEFTSKISENQDWVSHCLFRFKIRQKAKTWSPHIAFTSRNTIASLVGKYLLTIERQRMVKLLCNYLIWVSEHFILTSIFRCTAISQSDSHLCVDGNFDDLHPNLFARIMPALFEFLVVIVGPMSSSAKLFSVSSHTTLFTNW